MRELELPSDVRTACVAGLDVALSGLREPENQTFAPKEQT